MIKELLEMNELALFNKYDINGNLIYYLDKDCTEEYTGHIEEYDRGVLCREFDVVNGYLDGICKEYFIKSNKIESITQMKYNMQNGLYIDFYENGKVQSIAIAIDNDYIDYIIYDDQGNIQHNSFENEENRGAFIIEQQELRIQELRKKYDLMKIHEEIVRDGENFNYQKYFGL
jgi:antitoxin component YwqK of YwqJK toxin-antitoxin module